MSRRRDHLLPTTSVYTLRTVSIWTSLQVGTPVTDNEVREKMIYSLTFTLTTMSLVEFKGHKIPLILKNV